MARDIGDALITEPDFRAVLLKAF
ncbi:uncharacterized protein METZ01_LOCUS84889 [marine metagenome]|uniref:Uncharacterized protein n=1 Tax=marine metagenome TaxID=408172 RepID=A0A381UV83_9ZZZZ